LINVAYKDVDDASNGRRFLDLSIIYGFYLNNVAREQSEVGSKSRSGREVLPKKILEAKDSRQEL
jgi:hypothetical protein